MDNTNRRDVLPIKAVLAVGNCPFGTKPPKTVPLYPFPDSERFHASVAVIVKHFTLNF